ncbi:hypothetical protein GCM10025331_43170 [Actinoplanes utahensis]|nr:hypothetical protein Aut01nite_03080 [Actinoplanes utahensis]
MISHPSLNRTAGLGTVRAVTGVVMTGTAEDAIAAGRGDGEAAGGGDADGGVSGAVPQPLATTAITALAMTRRTHTRRACDETAASRAGFAEQPGGRPSGWYGPGRHHEPTGPREPGP